MSFTCETREGRRIVKTLGDITYDMSEELSELLRNEFEAGQKIVILDLAAARTIGSEGLSAIVSQFPLLQRKRAHLLLAGASPFVITILERVGFDKKLPLFPNVEAALAHPV